MQFYQEGLSSYKIHDLNQTTGDLTISASINQITNQSEPEKNDAC